MIILLTAIIFFVGYFIGSVPFAVIVSKIYGVSILKEGSFNAGATNVRRVIGKTAARIVFFLDFSKPIIAILLIKALILLHNNDSSVLNLSDKKDLLCSLVFLGAFLGHNFSIFLKFKGGKGVATTMGGFAILIPNLLAVALIVWLCVFFITRYVSLASILFAITIPVLCVFFASTPNLVSSLIISIIILLRHSGNIKRLLKKEEYRF